MQNFVFVINKNDHLEHSYSDAEVSAFYRYSLYVNNCSNVEWKRDNNYFIILYGKITNTTSLEKYGENVFDILINVFNAKGLNGFDLLRGNFAIILVDINEQITYIIKDYIGSKALYLFESPNAFYISSHSSNFSKFTSVEPEYINKVIFSENIYGKLSPFVNVENVCNGKVTVISKDNTIRKISYLETKGPIYYKNEVEYYEHFRELLNRSMLSLKDNNVGFALSGGLDSSLLWELFFLNNNATKGFTFDLSSFKNSDESELIKSYKRYDCVDKIDVKKGFKDMIVRGHYDEPNYYFLTNAWNNLIDFSKTKKCRYIVSGLGGDEITIGQSTISEYHSKESRNVSSFQINSDGIYKKEDDCSSSRFNNYCINLLKFRLYNGEIGRLIYRYEQDCFENNNVSLVLPYLEREVAEFCMSIPASIHIHHNTTKQLQRMAGKNLLPSKILFCKKKHNFNDWFITELSHEKELVFDLLNNSEIDMYYEQNFFRNIAEDFYNNIPKSYADTNKLGYTLMNFISCEVWLRKIKNKL